MLPKLVSAILSQCSQSSDGINEFILNKSVAIFNTFASQQLHGTEDFFVNPRLPAMTLMISGHLILLFLPLLKLGAISNRLFTARVTSSNFARTVGHRAIIEVKLSRIMPAISRTVLPPCCSMRL